MKKLTIKQRVEELLKNGWYSNYQINLEVKSSAGDREARRLRQNPPEGYVMQQRTKKIDGYNTCLEYKLERVLTWNNKNEDKESNQLPLHIQQKMLF